LLNHEHLKSNFLGGRHNLTPNPELDHMIMVVQLVSVSCLRHFLWAAPLLLP